jgi:hypothetical protein
MGTRGGPGATPSWEVEAGALGHAAVPELPQAGRWESEPWDTRPRAPALNFVLNWSLYVGVPGPQGTDSGPRAHPGRGCEPVGGANILFPCSLSESCTLGF